MTRSQQKRFDQLVDELESQAISDEKRQQLIALWQQNRIEDPVVSELLSYYFKVPREPARRYEGENIAQYKIQHLIGEGANGAIYQAVEKNQDFEISREIAIKLLHPSHQLTHKKNQFVNEIKTCFQKLGHHSHIAPILAVGMFDDPAIQESVPFYVMPYIKDAQNLHRYAHRHQLNLKEKICLFVQVCDAIRHAHRADVIHGDLKPDNILVDPTGQVFVIDFGLAKAQHLGLLPRRSGTPGYMSPELLSDPEQPVMDELQDVYSLGVILREILSPRETPIFATVLQKATALERSDRFQSVAQLVREIESIKTRRYRDTRHKHMGYWLAGTGSLSLFGVIAGLIYDVYALLEIGMVMLQLSAMLGGVWCLTWFSYRTFKALHPLWNNTFMVSFCLSMVGVLIGAVVYALSRAQVQGEVAADLDIVWYVRLLRYVSTGVVLSFLFSAVFAIPAGQRINPDFDMKGWNIIAWIIVTACLLVILYVTTHIMQYSSIAFFLGKKLQGDVRLEIYLLQLGISIFLMVIYANWKRLEHETSQSNDTITSSAFVIRILAAMCWIGLSGLSLAYLLWGRGLMEDRDDATLAIMLVTLLVLWTVTNFSAFTGRHWLVQSLDNGKWTRCLEQWSWAKTLPHYREKYKHKIFSLY